MHMKKAIFGIAALFLLILIHAITSISCMLTAWIEGQKWQPSAIGINIVISGVGYIPLPKPVKILTHALNITSHRNCPVIMGTLAEYISSKFRLLFAVDKIPLY